ncbi:MAG: BrnA antitoxin family protein [Caldilineales bacterium]|nr:BrnA antitoxin family protein [Caldilineales bacterium]MCW5860366.1 BrnA antitoxin family protein [Caldilineales bacterium]
MLTELKVIPVFNNEDEEREFWSSQDSTEYVDWEMAEPVVFSKLKPTTRSISLRLPVPMLDELRLLANKHDVSYQSLIKLYLRERIDEELRPVVMKVA